MRSMWKRKEPMCRKDMSFQFSVFSIEEFRDELFQDLPLCELRACLAVSCAGGRQIPLHLLPAHGRKGWLADPTTGIGRTRCGSEGQNPRDSGNQLGQAHG